MHLPIPAGTRRRSRRAGRAAIVAAAVSVFAVPAVADAATVSRASDGTINVVASSGETNFITVSEPVAGTVAVRDLIAVRRGNGCVSISATEVRCGLASRVNARLGDRNDTYVAQTGLATVVDGGAGDDTYFHDGSAGLTTTRVDFTGGSGIDTATYTAAAGAGVHVNKDGLPNDGRTLSNGATTIDRDNIRADIENLIGTQRNDILIGAGGTGTGTETYRALGGNDIMIGNGGNDTFETGIAPDGADRIVGGNDQHFDSVSYANRSVGVAVFSDDGQANDGQSGEGDEIIGVEGLFGSPQNDALFGSTSSTRGMLIMGARGNDTLGGTAGSDTLFGEDGDDRMIGNAGADNLFAGDGQRDSLLDCGTNPANIDDFVERDAIDAAPTGCETARIGRLSLAPRTLSAITGEPVRVKLRWRHPRSWKALRAVTLRITDANVPVGIVTVRPRGERIAADGIVKLVRRASRLSRDGKVVTARLALRIPRSLAGRRLAVSVDATDIRGRRQVEPSAGTIRVAK